ncbi:MAG: TetR/AcrR family transcriptional regulator [Chloroflexota bacterium]
MTNVRFCGIIMTERSVIYRRKLMPRVSARNREQYLQERREAIVDAAIEVFGKKGFDKANVEDIAKAADIGKGTVYLYFKSKEEIFSAIVGERTLLPKMTQMMAIGDVPLEEALTRIAESYLEYAREHLSVFRLVLTDSHRFPAHAEQVYTGIILRGCQMLANLLKEQIKAKKIRKLDDPFVTARAFLGMLTTYVLTQEILGGKRFTPLKPAVWVKEVVRLFLDGVRK